ncbi:exopolysaccharide biosynthesis protein [Phreatobacter oligotrophus]|uniref:exopolysaccharide biosynthesis protein n=1 Tax=Phreatobacter oligotrophus TaxID=1122261 RepID=UPI002353F8F6|nr:exopolysaccharide biosynthesis protein [Phreatobacter oligotrophus]MBX9990278.1 exopolysaccharide biosynthesis protein [Phreatobacter oligotrophus]
MQTPEKTSQIIASLMSAQTSSQAEVIGTLTVGDLMASLRTRAFGLSLILFGLPNLLPIPGLPILTGIILALLAVQIVVGRDVPWLPARIAGTTLPRERLNQVMARTLPLLRWIERVTKPRFALAAGPTARRVVGLTVLVLAVLLIILPIPWIGSMPQGLALCVLGLGLTERDGVLVTAGFVLAAVATAVGAGIGYTVFAGALAVMN